jgi:uncharacterized protein involved in exopolysaccharide biosynthesis
VSQDTYLAEIGDPHDDQESKLRRREDRDRQIRQMRLLWENRRFLLRCAAWGLVFSALVAIAIPSRYQATTQLMPPDNQSGSGAAALLSAVAGRAGAGGLGSLAGDVLGVKNSGALFIGILSTRTVQDRIIQQFELNRVYRDSKPEDTRLDLAKHTGISEDRKSGIISISVIDHDPQRAAAISSAYVQELDRLVAEVSTSSARRERIFLEQRLAAVKQELDAAAGKFSEFASKNTAIDIPAQGKAMVEAAARLQGELIAAESELRGLEAIYTDKNVRVRALRARVNELQAQLEKLGGDTGETKDPLARNVTAMYPSIRRLPILGVTYADLYQRAKIQATVFELLTQQYELAKVQEAKEIPSVKVLDPAVVPTKKSFPPRIVITVVGTTVVFLSACFWLFSRQHWRNIDSQDSGKQFAYEVASSLRSSVQAIAPAAASFRQALRRDRATTTEVRTEEEVGGETAPGDVQVSNLSRAAGKGSD